MFKEAYSDTSKVQCCNNIDAFNEYEIGKTNINVKGRLENSVHFWQKIGTSDFILDMIYEGYTIPLLHEPKSVFLNNNKSVNVLTICVENAISELISDGLVRGVSSAPHVVNPLTIAVNGKDKVKNKVKSKTDCYRNGKNVVISKLDSLQCPLNILKESLGSIGLKAVDFGLHSLRSGGATAAYSCGVSDRLFKIHGRWKSEQAKDGYVLDDIQKRLSVLKNLGN
jgi:hypothetical protein